MKDCGLIERLLEFVPCEDIKGKTICDFGKSTSGFRFKFQDVLFSDI